MNDSHNISADDIALIRAAAGDGGRSVKSERGAAGSTSGSAAGRSPRRPRKGAASTVSRNKNAQQKPERKVDPDERFRQVLALLLGLGGFLLLLALISYSRFDQANTDIRPTELTGLLTNDPDIAARADTTENWLGLLGAFFSNFLLNGTIGWFAIVVPVLLGYWSVIVFSGKDISRGTRTSLFTLLLGTLGAALLGTVTTISWMPEIAHEWSGAVGAFLASILTSLAGSVGSTLVLLAGIIIAVIYALDVDVKKLVAFIKTHSGTVGAQFSKTGARWKTIMAAEGKSKESGKKSQPIPADQTGAVAIPNLDHEPARMTRRISAANGADASYDRPEPSINRPTFGRKEESVPSAERTNGRVADRINAEIPMPEALLHQPPPSPIGAEQVLQPKTTPTEVATAAVAGAAGMANKQMARASETETSGEAIRGVTLTRAPLEDAPYVEPPKLTVLVEDGETDADLEMLEAGKLIEKLRNEEIKYDPPPIELLTPQEAHNDVDDEELKTNARLLQEKLRTFNIEIENLTVTPGPVVTLFEFVPAAGIKLSQIESLGDDIALALKARGIRIIAPIPGKGTVGVEIPNHNPAMVRIRSVLNTTKFREAEMRLPLALGKTTVGEVYCDDLSKMPHLLIAGATGSGKSVGINSILISLLYKMHPSDLKLAIIDPKKIELTQYRALIDHFLVSCPDIDEDIVTDPQNAVLLLKSLEMEMDRRYDMLAKSGQRNIFDYNKKIEEGLLKPTPAAPHVKLPFIVLIIDELADLMITASKEVEEPIARLAQLARAIGIHIIVATQRPSVDVLTGMIKANFPARIAYQVASKTDSRTILDMNGAEQLLGNGDMLYLPGGRPKPLRLQNAFLSTEEVEAICEHIGNQKGYSQPYLLPSVAEKKKGGSSGGSNERDELFDEAARLVVRHQQGSVSLIQRRLKVGYARAARIVDELEDAGIVGSFDGSKARAVLLESEAELEAFL